MKKVLNIVVGIIRLDDKYLAVQREESKYDYISYKWEFPGGKIEPNESREDAILRELEEELRIKLNSPEFLTRIEYSYPDFDITMDCFLFEIKEDKSILVNHINKKWLKKDELMKVEWAAADILILDYLPSIK